MVFVASLDGEREGRRGLGLFELLRICDAFFELFEFFGLFDLVRERVLRLRGCLQDFGLPDLFGLLEFFGLDFSGLSTERLSTSFVGDLDRD